MDSETHQLFLIGGYSDYCLARFSLAYCLTLYTIFFDFLGCSIAIYKKLYFANFFCDFVE